MSEPTYRIELSHHPENGSAVEWQAAVYSVAEYDPVLPYMSSLHNCYAGTREDAFNDAQTWVKAKSREPLAPSTVFLTEDGEIHDQFDVGRIA